MFTQNQWSALVTLIFCLTSVLRRRLEQVRSYLSNCKQILTEMITVELVMHGNLKLVTAYAKLWFDYTNIFQKRPIWSTIRLCAARILHIMNPVCLILSEPLHRQAAPSRPHNFVILTTRVSAIFLLHTFSLLTCIICDGAGQLDCTLHLIADPSLGYSGIGSA